MPMVNPPECADKHLNAYAKLDPSWRDWILECIQMGCTTQSMAEAMVQSGSFSESQAKSTLKEALGKPHPKQEPAFKIKCLGPDIDTRPNYIDLDRRIDILMAVASPRIVVLGNVLSEQECEFLIAYAGQHTLSQSQISYLDSHVVNAQARICSEVVFQRAEVDVIKTIENRLSALVSWPVDRSEGFKVMRYDEGGFFIPHFDGFDARMPGYQKMLEQGGQRVGTFVLYLSDVEEGGSTSFPKLELGVRPHRGMGVFFVNADTGGQLDRLAYHSGEPVIAGVKWIAVKWLRAKNI